MQHISKFSWLLPALLLLAACSHRYGGLTLYTVREDMKKQPKEVIQKISDLGYKYIEAAGYENGKFHGMAPTEFKNYLHENC